MKMILIRFGLLFLTVHLALSFQLVNQWDHQGFNTDDCKLKTETNQTAYLGWPLSITCEFLVSDLEDTVYEDDTNDRAYCMVYDLDRNEVVLNKTGSLDGAFSDISYNIDRYNKSSSSRFLLKAGLTANKSVCYISRVHLVAIKLPKMSCKESLKSFNLSKHKIAMQHNIKFFCEPPDNHPYHFHKDLRFDITWYRNCEEIPNIERNFAIKAASFEHPGVYSCSVFYNGMERYINHYEMCVSRQLSGSEHPLKCTKKIYKAEIGSNVTIECLGSDDLLANTDRYVVQWLKLSDGNPRTLCSNHNTGEVEDSNIVCSYHVDRTCFNDVPSDQELEELKAGVVMKLTIKNVQEDDFDFYTVSLTEHSVAKNITKFTSNATFSIAHNKKHLLKRQTELVTFLIVLFLFCVFTTTLIWWKFLYLKFFWRKHIEPFKTDDKLFGAFLSYQFNSEMDKFCKEQTREAVATVRDELENIGFKVYDEFRNSNYDGYKSENVINAMKQCHRVVIILSSEYLKDHWSIFMLNKSFEEMIYSQAKLIFILLPGVKEFIKQNSLRESEVQMVQRAIKTNYSISWGNTERFNSKKFKIRLRLAMPNISVKSNHRHMSTSSSLIFTQEDSDKRNLKRTMSNETGMTELSSPVSLDVRFLEFETESSRKTSNGRIV